MIDLIGIGAIALAFTIIFVIVHLEGRQRQREMGLRDLTEPLQDLKQPTRAEETWHQHMPRWSDTRYFGGSRRRP